MLRPSFIDRIRLAIAIAHGLQFQEELDGFEEEGMQNVAEVAWYQTVTHCLTTVFKENPRITLNPQRPFKRLLHSDSKQKDIVKKRIPDFTIFLSQYKVVYDFPIITRTAAIMIVEVKGMPKPGNSIINMRYSAWNQALEQAAYVLAKAKWQKAIGIMICIGVEWAFAVIGEAMIAKLPEHTDDDYKPGEESQSEESQSEDSDIDLQLPENELESLTGFSIGRRENRPIRPLPPNANGPVTRLAVLRARAAASVEHFQSDLSEADSSTSSASTGVRPYSAEAARPGQGPPSEPGGEDNSNSRRKKRKARFFDPSTSIYYRYGTNDSKKALSKVRKELKRMPGFQTEDWQKAFTDVNDFNDMQKMFDNIDAGIEPPAGC